MMGFPFTFNTLSNMLFQDRTDVQCTPVVVNTIVTEWKDPEITSIDSTCHDRHQMRGEVSM